MKNTSDSISILEEFLIPVPNWVPWLHAALPWKNVEAAKSLLSAPGSCQRSQRCKCCLCHPGSRENYTELVQDHKTQFSVGFYWCIVGLFFWMCEIVILCVKLACICAFFQGIKIMETLLQEQCGWLHSLWAIVSAASIYRWGNCSKLVIAIAHCGLCNSTNKLFFFFGPL